MSDNYTPGDNRGSQGEIRYLSIAKVSDAHLLLTLPTANTKKAYAEEVWLNKFLGQVHFQTNNIFLVINSKT